MMRSKNSRTYVISMPMGLDVVAVQELAEKVPGHQLLERASHEITVSYGGPPGDLTSLRSVSDVWLQVADIKGAGTHYRDLRQLQERLARLRLEPSIEVLKQAGFRPRRSMRFAVYASMRGTRSYRRLDALQAAEEAIATAFRRQLQPVRQGGDIRFQFHIEEDRARLALSLTEKPLGLRERLGSLPASLPGPVAYAMAYLTKPGDNDVFVDAMCGSGNIALERAENWRYQLIVAGDIDQSAIATTQLNFGRRHRPREFVRWDAAHLPLPDESVDAIACNPPHGIQMVPEGGLKHLYSGFLTEGARVLRRWARLTFLTPERDLTDSILARIPQLRIERCFVIDLLGQRPYIYVLRRVS